jgi:WW domain-containing oxidoreductase
MVLDTICSIKRPCLAWSDITKRKKVQVGASTNVYCAVAPNIEKGAFYADNQVNTVLLNKQANNQDMARKLWQVSDKMVNEKLDQRP